MKKNIFKKLFIKISKLVGYELIDQNEFYSPTLEKNLDEKLSCLLYTSPSPRDGW